MADKTILDLELADEFSDDLNFPVDDTIQTYRATGAQIDTWMKGVYQRVDKYLKNIGLSVTAGSSAITVALKQIDGTTNPTSGRLSSQALFRSTTITSGAKVLVEFDAALSIVIPSTATMGYGNGDNAKVYVYLYYDGSNKGLMVSNRLLDERDLYSFTAIGTGSDGNGLYADAIRTGAAIRLIGEFSVDAITTAGTWTTPTTVSAVGAAQKPAASSLSAVSSADKTIITNDNIDVVLMTTANSNRTVNLPAAANNTGRKLKIVKVDTGTGTVIVDPNASETVNGAPTFTMYTQYMFVEIISDGTNWLILDEGQESFSTTSPTITNGGTSPSGKVIIKKHKGLVTYYLNMITGASGSPTSQVVFAAGTVPTWARGLDNLTFLAQFGTANNELVMASWRSDGAIRFDRSIIQNAADTLISQAFGNNASVDVGGCLAIN